MNGGIGYNPAISAPLVHAVEAQGWPLKSVRDLVAEGLDNGFEPGLDGGGLGISERGFDTIAVERLFSEDLSFLQEMYNRINGLSPGSRTV